MPLSRKGIYCFSDFQLNLDLRTLAREGQRVSLGAKAYDILTCLAMRSGTIVSKSDLLKEVWPESYVEEGTLAQHIFSLRKVLGDHAGLIVTVPGQGYRLDAAVRHLLPEPTTEWAAGADSGILHEMRERTHLVVEEPVPAAQPAPQRFSTALRISLAAAALVLVVGGIAGWKATHRPAPRDFVGVVVADFLNGTGDATFDHTLKRALEIDLGQSPFMDVMSDMEGVSILGQMGRKPDTPLTSPVAREICERTNRAVLLTGTISSFGSSYLLTLEATDCRTGKELAASKATAAGKDNVLKALDAIASTDRSRLGESAQSLKNYGVPIAQGATSSLDALRAYSVGVYLLNQGKIGKEAAPFFEKAIQLDPHFPEAYGELAAAYYNMQESQLAGEYTNKLCALNAQVGERTKLAIDGHCEKDIFGQIKIFRMWTEEYPHDWIPWLNIANIYNQTGQPEVALPYARAALEKSGRNEISYDVLIRSLKNTQRFAEAKSVEADAIARHKDSDSTHGDMREIAVFEHNKVDYEREAAWYQANKGQMDFYGLAEAAAMEGRIRQAEDLFAKELATDRQQQETELADSVRVDEATMEREIGRTGKATTTLAAVSAQVRVDPTCAVEHALEGDEAFGRHFIELQKDPSTSVADPTFVPNMMLPQLRAAMAMHANNPQQAIAELENARPMELADYSTPTQRGAAYLATRQGKLAETQYKEILANPGLFLNVEYPLAHLGLARAYALEADAADSRKEYDAFLALWKDADPDVPVLIAAKSERQHLPK